MTAYLNLTSVICRIHPVPFLFSCRPTSHPTLNRELDDSSTEGTVLMSYWDESIAVWLLCWAALSMELYSYINIDRVPSYSVIDTLQINHRAMITLKKFLSRIFFYYIWEKNAPCFPWYSLLSTNLYYTIYFRSIFVFPACLNYELLFVSFRILDKL